MKKQIAAVLLLMLAFGAHADQSTGNVNFFLGQKSLESDDWAPVEDHGSFGVLVDFANANWPVNFAVDFLGSYGEETVGPVKLEGTTSEINLGLRKIWNVGGTSMRPYIGGGIAFVRGEFKATDLVSVSVDDNGVGLWLNGGIYWTLGQSFNLGLDLRYTRADIELLGFDVEAGGNYAGLLLGYHW